MTNSPHHNLDQWLEKLLESIYRKKNRKRILEKTYFNSKETNHMDISYKFMVLYDVHSLFTNVPIREPINITHHQSELLVFPLQLVEKIITTMQERGSIQS